MSTKEFVKMIADKKKIKKQTKQTLLDEEYDGGEDHSDLGSADSDFELNGDTAPAYVEKKYTEIKWDLFWGLLVFLLICGVVFGIINMANPYTSGGTTIKQVSTALPDPPAVTPTASS